MTIVMLEPPSAEKMVNLVYVGIGWEKKEGKKINVYDLQTQFIWLVKEVIFLSKITNHERTKKHIMKPEFNHGEGEHLETQCDDAYKWFIVRKVADIF